MQQQCTNWRTCCGAVTPIIGSITSRTAFDAFRISSTSAYPTLSHCVHESLRSILNRLCPQTMMISLSTLKTTTTTTTMTMTTTTTTTTTMMTMTTTMAITVTGRFEKFETIYLHPSSRIPSSTD